MINRIFMKVVSIAGTDYQAEIRCNEVENNKFILYGRLRNSDGTIVYDVPSVRRTVKTREQANSLIGAVVYAVSTKIPDRNKALKPNRERSIKSETEMDKVVSMMLETETVFYTVNETGSKTHSWNKNTHRTVYTYWLSHGISGLLYRLSESDDPETELEEFRNTLVNKTIENGRSAKNREKAERTVAVNLARMNILLQYLRKDHPDFPAFDLTKGVVLSGFVPEEQMKCMPEGLCQYFTRQLESRVETEGRYVLCAVLMYDGALRTAEAAGTKRSCLVFYDDYCVVKVMYQEQDGKRIDRLKTDNAYRYVVLSYWGMTMIRRCLAVLKLNEDDDCLLVKADDLSRWIRTILNDYDPNFMEDAERIQRSNPDYDESGKPVNDISAYVLRRNAASRWLNYDGLTHDEIDIMLGHKEKAQRAEVYLMDETHQQEIAMKLEHYVYNPKCTRNPAFNPVIASPNTKTDLEAYSVHRIVNTSNQPLRIHIDITACSPNEEIRVKAPLCAAGAVTCRSEKLKPASRIVINSNVIQGKGDE